MTPEQPTVTSNQTTNWDITVAVCNNGGSELTYLIDSTRVEIVPEYPLPYIKPTEFDEGGTSLSAGECKHLTFTVTSTPDIPDGEDLILHSRVGFTENNSGEFLEYDTQSEGSGDGTVRVEAPADISLTRVLNKSHRAPYVNTDQGFPVLFEVSNAGEATAEAIVVTLGTSGGSSIKEALITIPEITGGSAGIDTFHVTASGSSGEETLAALIESAVDANSGESSLVIISESADDTAAVVVQDPGELVVTTLIPSQTEVNAGQTADWYLRAAVENRGTAPITLDPPDDGDITFTLGSQLGDYIVIEPDTFASGTFDFVLYEDDIDTLIYTVATTGSDTGWVDIRATLGWEDTNAPDVIQTAAYRDTTVHVKKPSGLRIVSITSEAPNSDSFLNISTVNTLQTFDIIVGVENTGGDDIDSVEVELVSNNGTTAILTADHFRSIHSGGAEDFTFNVKASEFTGEEVLTASIIYAISVNTGEPVEPLEAVEKTENVVVQLPALLSVSTLISAPAGAMNDTVSVDQEFVLSADVENEGTASVNASGLVTLTLPSNMTRVDPGSEPLERSFTPGTVVSWRINAPSDPSPGDDITVAITNAPNDINIAAACSIDVGVATVTVVTEDIASIDVAGFYFESPEGAVDGILSTEQECIVAAVFTASTNCDSVRLELVLPSGFTVSNGLVQYVGEGSGIEDTLRWNVTAPSFEVISETIRVIPRGKDINSGESFTDTEKTLGVQVVQKAVLDLTYRITSPDEAIDRVLSVGLVFTVTADVVNLGTAGVDTTGARLEIELPPGYELENGSGETYRKPFYPSEPVMWSLQAPDSPQPTPADITVEFAVSYATDENTGQSAALIEDQAPISVVTEEGQLKMTNLSHIDTIPPYVVPQGSEDVPVLCVGLQNSSAYTLGLDTLYLTVERGGGQVVSDPSRYITAVELVTDQNVFPAVVLSGNPIPIVVSHDFTIPQSEADTFLIRVDIAGSAPVGELRFDISDSDDIIFMIGTGGPRIQAVWAGDGGNIAGHFLSGPLSVMSKDFEEYVHNYPNPFRAGSESTRIAYFMTEDASVSIKIYDLMGNLVFTKDISAGEPGASGTADGTWCETEWDGRNDRGDVVRNGVYLCKIQAGSRTVTFKIAVAK
jgi:hypothetical protein